jgi:hypothetical protein
MTANWQWVDASHRVVMRINDDGLAESHTVEAPEIAAWIASGGVPDAAPVLPPSSAPIDARIWLERLPMPKQLAIAAAGIANPTLMLWLLKAAGAQDGVDVTNPDTTTGLSALVAAGVITTADQATLLAP